jgi:hypothetical protein
MITNLQVNMQLQQTGQQQLDFYLPDKGRIAQAQDELSLFFYTSCTPPERANNPHLQRALAILGAQLPHPSPCSTPASPPPSVSSPNRLQSVSST